MATLKDCLTVNNKSQEMDKLVNELIKNLFHQINDNHSPARFIINNFPKAIRNLGDLYFKTFKQKCVVTSYKNNNFYEYVGKKSKLNVKYNDDAYFNAMQYQMSLLLAKYKELHECQIKLAFMLVLINYYNFYGYFADTYEYVLNFNANTIKNYYDTIMNKEINEFPLLVENKEVKDAVHKNLYREEVFVELPTKPRRVEDLTRLFDDDMSQSEKVKLVAAYYECSEKTASRYMEKFGLWHKVRGTKKPIEPDVINSNNFNDFIL